MDKLKDFLLNIEPRLLSNDILNKYRVYNVETAAVNLLEFKRVLDKYNINFWISHGTLLGVYRDGKLIDYDHDCDISLKVSEFSKFIDAHEGLLEVGFKPIRLIYNERKFQRSVSYGRKKTYIDVMGYRKINNDLWERMPGCVLLRDSQIKELNTIKFQGETFNVVQDIERYLLAHYGKKWRQPIKKLSAWSINKCKKHPGFEFATDIA